MVASDEPSQGKLGVHTIASLLGATIITEKGLNAIEECAGNNRFEVACRLDTDSGFDDAGIESPPQHCVERLRTYW
jgi:hypothetical protein